MRKFIFVCLLAPLTIASAQLKDRADYDLNFMLERPSQPSYQISSGLKMSGISDTLDLKPNKRTASKKSPGLAFIYSLLVPGMGQVYANRFDVGKYYLISEAALWLGYVSFTVYGNWLLDDAYSFAEVHAGINRDGKDDDFFINIGNYDNVEQYNNDKLQRGEYDKLYYPGTGYDFYWDLVSSRKMYREDKIGGDRTINDRAFIVGAVIVNHIVSAISAIILANKHNDELKKSSGGFTITSDLTRHRNRIDGLKFKLTKWF